VPQGGLEIVDVTVPTRPVEIGLTSHIGEAHTVNIDPKRPHIAIVSSSDTVTVNADGTRANEDPASGERFDLDGIEIVDLSSCMNFPAGTSVAEKRAACRPEVYRYRYPNTEMSVGHTLKTGSNAIFGCHETEIYPNDLLTCGSGNTLIELDLSGAFDRNGTPEDFSDDKPVGTPLPCRVRASSSLPPFNSGAMITDCVDGLGAGTDDLTPGPRRRERHRSRLRLDPGHRLRPRGRAQRDRQHADRDGRARRRRRASGRLVQPRLRQHGGERRRALLRRRRADDDAAGLGR
jgi:hypothetical protein